jgi:probable HAF family extracellular repeat protein
MRPIAAAALAVAAVAAHSAPTFVAVDLGPSWESTNVLFPTAYPTAINDAGQVVGYVATSYGGYMGLSYINGQTSPGGQARYTGVSDEGVIIGWTYTGTENRAFAQTRTGVHDLGSLGGTDTQAQAISRSGKKIVGYSERSNGAYHAFLFEHGKMKDIGMPAGARESYGLGVNDAGVVVGNALFGGKLHAFRYENGDMVDLGGLARGGWSEAAAINNAGLIVGTATTRASVNSIQHAVVVRDGVMQDLGSLTPRQNSMASAVNEAGHVVGQSGCAGCTSFRAVYVDETGMHDINTLTSLEPGWILEFAVAINEHDQIVCRGWSDPMAPEHVFLLTPVTP